jgi:hypothetical protein
VILVVVFSNSLILIGVSHAWTSLHFILIVIVIVRWYQKCRRDVESLVAAYCVLKNECEDGIDPNKKRHKDSSV